MRLAEGESTRLPSCGRADMIRAFLERLDLRMGVGPGWGLPLVLLMAAVVAQLIGVLVTLAIHFGWLRQFVRWL